MEREHNSSFHLPPGFRFHPTDEELIIHYLQNKVASRPLPASAIAEIDLYKYNPWELPKKALFGKDEWYFFSPRDRKYPNGARPNRAAVKKALVFYRARSPKGVKTDWIMNEYRLLGTATKSSKSKGAMRVSG
ncbi:hypothetical protein SLEP1_g7172 [Rubroshorea leprosula]|uniref:NAC domain-containing protein n=1 Tax=Rubroshorea leprosula TaxID=152421 RepID=A0AAV5HXI6_9ROSI|nr:hypothetical protein SLEP1_g7172 [Rubroshorea leprosula]